MMNLYNLKPSFKHKLKLKYFSPKVWRTMYLIHTNSVHASGEKKIFTRSSTVPITFMGQEVFIYNGKSWYTRQINIWLVGYKFGEFTWNKKSAKYKSKQKKKKKKK